MSSSESAIDEYKFKPHPDDKTLRYDTMTMLKLASIECSRTRPKILSEEFNDDNGLWQPEKWLEFKWSEEGLKSRGVMQRKQLAQLRADHPCLDTDDSAVLSPQRKDFATGCRPKSPAKHANNQQSQKREIDRERIGADKRDWRSGATGFNKYAANNSEPNREFNKAHPSTYSKFVPNRANANPYQKNKSNSWRDSFHPSFNRSQQHQQNRRPYGHHRREESLPEWLSEGPDSHLDTIELKGFDDDKHRDSERSMPSSNGSQRKRSSAGEDRPHPSSNEDPALPSSDADFAAMLGLLDVGENDQKHHGSTFKKEAEAKQSNSSGGSRFSKFFKTLQQRPPSNNGRSDANDRNNNADRMLKLINNSRAEPQSSVQKLFDNPQKQQQPQQTMPVGRHSMMTLEELEHSMLKKSESDLNGGRHQAEEQHRMLMKTLEPNQQMIRQQLSHNQLAKGNPLGQFLTKLQKLKQTPDDSLRKSPSPLQAAAAQAEVMLPNDPLMTAALMAQYNVQAQFASMCGRMQQPQQRGNFPLRPPLMPPPSDMMSNPAALKMMYMQMLQQQQRQSPPLMNGAQQQQVRQPNPSMNQFMPTSVLRQMAKQEEGKKVNDGTMSAGLPMNACRPPIPPSAPHNGPSNQFPPSLNPNMYQQAYRAQAAAVQQQMVLQASIMRGVDQMTIQGIRHRLNSLQQQNIQQQQPRNRVPSSPPLQSQHTSGSSGNEHKYPNPLEKLLQSMGDPNSQQLSIYNRLPPSAQAISAEDLEKIFTGEN